MARTNSRGIRQHSKDVIQLLRLRIFSEALASIRSREDCAPVIHISGGNTVRSYSLQDFGRRMLACTPSFASTSRRYSRRNKTRFQFQEAQASAGIFGGGEPWTEQKPHGDRIEHRIDRLRYLTGSPR
jgi:phenylacetate-coenzyme A ligase PaaK-like adenylate-forming protein